MKSVNKKSNQEIKSEISRLQSEMSKRGQPKRKPKRSKAASSQGPMVSAPQNASRSQKTSEATFRSTGNKSVCVVHSELIRNVSTLQAGWHIIDRFRVNPASAKTFPWLSTIAGSWESYRFRKLRFRYIGRTPTTTAGSMILSPDYDAQDGQPVSEITMSSYKDTVEDGPWKTLLCNLNTSTMNRLYKGHVNMDDARFAATTQDEKTIDAGQLFIAADSDGIQNWGKLWVDYEVEFYTPQSPTLGIAEDGASLSIGIGCPTATSGLFTNTKAQCVITQDLAAPIVEAIDNSTVNSGNFAKVLRDWVGDIGLTYASNSTGQAGQPQFVNTIPIYVNGVAQSIGPDFNRTFCQNNTLVAGETYTNARSGSNVYTNTLKMMRVALKAGDLLGIAPSGLGTVVNGPFPGLPQIDVILGGLKAGLV